MPNIKLFIHIGTEKTGSSYLQSMITMNKKKLREMSIFVPDSKWDERMLKGIISPGNGHELAKIIAAESREKELFEYLLHVFQLAERSKCAVVLLSNEVLIKLFSDKERLYHFEQYALKAGFESISFLVYLRNFYEQALSLYKHQAKWGKHPDYNLWFENHYKTLILLEPFLQNIRLSCINVRIIVYEKDSKKIIQGFLNWLEINISIADLVLKTIPVNPSLRLNQIKWIHHLGNLYQGISPILHYALIHSDESVENECLVEQFQAAAKRYFENHQDIINSVKEMLSSTQWASIDFVPEMTKSNKCDESLKVSPKEFDIILNAVISYSRFYQLKRLGYLLREKGRKYYRKIIGKKKNNMDRSQFGGSLRH